MSKRQQRPLPESSPAPKVSGLKRAASSLAAAVIIPLVTFGILEVALRLAGFGYSTSFFKKAVIGGRQVYIENPEFGYRFFPKEIARVPSPVVFPAVRASNTFRIFVLGESAALGDPEPAFGVCRFLGALLEERFPETQFEVIPAAMTAINSHALLPIAEECAHLGGDAWIVYMGNNEFVGPYGASSVFGAKAPPRWMVRAVVLLKETKTGQLLEALQRKISRGKQATEWGSMAMFAQNTVSPSDPRRHRVYQSFEANLAEILRIGRRSGARVIASTVLSNLKDCAPFASSPVDSENAEVFFRKGRVLAIANEADALENLTLARDDDALPFRADSTINRLIQKTAAGMHFECIDASAALPTKIPGEEFLYEHVHLNPQGNYLLAKTFAESIERALPSKINATFKWASFEETKRRLALTEWDERRVHEDVARRISQPPFTSQSNHANQIDSLRRKLADLKTKMTPVHFAEVKTWYEEAIKRAPDDFYLHGNYAKLLEENDDPKSAIAQWEEVQRLLPHEPVAYLNRGKLLGQTGDVASALENLQTALKIHPGLIDALDEESKIYLRAGKPEEAMKVLQQMSQLRPNNPRVHMGMAEALARLNRRNEALPHLERAVELQPANWEARYLLGVEYATLNRIPEAEAQFTQVVRLRPDYALAHLNLGVALAKQNKLREAAAEFQQTLRYDPENASAKGFLKQLGVPSN